MPGGVHGGANLSRRAVVHVAAGSLPLEAAVHARYA
jgi:hypothetical protein